MEDPAYTKAETNVEWLSQAADSTLAPPPPHLYPCSQWPGGLILCPTPTSGDLHCHHAIILHVLVLLTLPLT